MSYEQILKTLRKKKIYTYIPFPPPLEKNHHTKPEENQEDRKSKHQELMPLFLIKGNVQL